MFVGSCLSCCAAAIVRNTRGSLSFTTTPSSFTCPHWTKPGAVGTSSILLCSFASSCSLSDFLPVTFTTHSFVVPSTHIDPHPPRTPAEGVVDLSIAVVFVRADSLPLALFPVYVKHLALHYFFPSILRNDKKHSTASWFLQPSLPKMSASRSALIPPELNI